MPDPKQQLLHELQQLGQSIASVTERARDLPDRMPLGIHPRSVDYHADLSELQREYNQRVAAAVTAAVLDETDLRAAGLPLRLEPRP